MTRQFLVVDGECPQCSDLGRRLNAVAPDVVAISMNDPVLQGVIGIDQVRAPALIHVNDGRVVSQFNGIRMRVRLAHMVGFSRYRSWLPLLRDESAATDHRTGGAPSRRTLLLGALAAIAAGGSVTGVLGTATAQASSTGYRALSAAETDKTLRQSQQIENVFQRMGPMREAKTVRSEGTELVAIFHQGSDAVTYVSRENPDIGGTIVPDGNDRLSVSLLDGLHIGDVVISGTSVSFEPAPHDSARQSGAEAIAAKKNWSAFFRCIRDKAADNLIEDPDSCIPNCLVGPAACALCLGPKTITYVIACWPKLSS